MRVKDRSNSFVSFKKIAYQNPTAVSTAIINKNNLKGGQSITNASNDGSYRIDDIFSFVVAGDDYADIQDGSIL
jgi:hypothetical protein